MENDLETSLFNIFINAFEQVGQSLWKTIWRPASGWMGGEENVGGWGEGSSSSTSETIGGTPTLEAALVGMQEGDWVN